MVKNIIVCICLIFLCSCKTKEVARKIKSDERITSDLAVLNEQTKIDTTKTKKVEQTEEFTRIIEEETITEYDTEKQTISKVTEKTKVTVSGKKKETDEFQDRGITSVQKDSTDHSLDITKKEDVKEETKEESVGSTFFKSFGKWIGISLIAACFIYLLGKKVHDRLIG